MNLYIVKVRLQTTQQYTGAIDCASKILKNEGALAFYKGTLTPLIGIGACVSVQFGAFHYMRRRFESQNLASNPLASSDLSYTQYYLCGAFAGIVNTPLSSPIEHVRIRLQTQPHGAGRLYAGPLDCIRQLGTRNIYRGTLPTLFREAQAYGIWFTTFEWLMRKDAARLGVRREDVPTWKVAFYGGLAGEALWLGSYPFDVIKSRMQTDGFGDKARYRGFLDCVRHTYRGEGAMGFWRGIGPTLVRAMPVSAGTFVTVELTMRLIR
ncbi:mitochondrial carrier protein [Patellaria atrata CBS 101060]|uniref:Mitochondrial carrier protein n=1 Tax=Patellaria atrata CBS 101060 TaxID=1346257 RepID=A0A9P4S0D9_9PEZI|nr:mitochondrial carrier protein [Patellaria atrata CBS 101060]